MTMEPADQPDHGDAHTGMDDPAPVGPEPQPFTRVCRRCAAQATTTSERCPACGARYARRRPSRRASLIGGGLGALLVVAASAALVLDHRRDEQRERDRVARVEAKREADRKAREEAAREAEEQAELEQALLEIERESYVQQLRKSITADAREKYALGLLESRANGTSCDNTDGNASDADASGADYSCLAITERDGSRASGYEYSARINYDDGSYTWELGD